MGFEVFRGSEIFPRGSQNFSREYLVGQVFFLVSILPIFFLVLDFVIQRLYILSDCLQE